MGKGRRLILCYIILKPNCKNVVILYKAIYILELRSTKKLKNIY